MSPFRVPDQVRINFIIYAIQRSMHQPELLGDERVVFPVLFAERVQQGGDDAADRGDHRNDDRGAIHQPD